MRIHIHKDFIVLATILNDQQQNIFFFLLNIYDVFDLISGRKLNSRAEYSSPLQV